jgi:proteasome lid subunit RPN8/RPN11
MLEHCAREAPLECCGLLGGMPPSAESIHPLRNSSQSETHYLADPQDVIVALQELRRRKHEIVAIYHSHPKWPPIPSKTDLRENYYGDVPRIIISLLAAEPETRVWRLDEDTFEELEWELVP